MDKSNLYRDRCVPDGPFVFEFSSEEKASEYRSVLRQVDRALQTTLLTLALTGLLSLAVGVGEYGPPLFRDIVPMSLFLCLVPLVWGLPKTIRREEMRDKAFHRYTKKEFRA